MDFILRQDQCSNSVNGSSSWSQGAHLKSEKDGVRKSLWFHASWYFTRYCQPFWITEPGPLLNIKTVFPRYGDSHVKGKTVVRPSYLYHGNSYTSKMTSLYWDGPQINQKHTDGLVQDCSNSSALAKKRIKKNFYSMNIHKKYSITTNWTIPTLYWRPYQSSFRYIIEGNKSFMGW